MDIQIGMDGEVTLVLFRGRLDSQTHLAAQDEVTILMDQGGRKLLLDLAELEYISSSGLRLFLIMAKQVKEIGGEMRLCSLSPLVKEIFEISGFDRIFKVFANKKDALNEF